MLTKAQMLEMLKADVVPALGCTEPVCVALSVADAAKAIGGKIEKIEVKVNANIYKNGMSAGIPNFHAVGLHYASAIGAVLKNPEKKLELLQDLTKEAVEEVEHLIKEGMVSVTIDETQASLFVESKVTTEYGMGLSITKDSHTNIILTKANENILFEKQLNSISSDNQWIDNLKEMTFAQIRQLVDTATVEELEFMLDGVAMNEALSEYHLEHTQNIETDKKAKNEIGIGIAKTFQKNMGTNLLSNDLMNKIMLRVMAAAENRLDGCPYPTMSSAGAGTKGLVVILPISEMAKTIQATKEQTVKALAFGHLINRYVNAYVGKLAAVCTCCMASSTAACAGMTWLLGGNDEQIGYAIRNMTGTITGMICDGGKVGCAMKVATSSVAALTSAIMAVNNVALRVSDGICAKTPEQCIKNISQIANPGMVRTDKEILDIMLKK